MRKFIFTLLLLTAGAGLAFSQAYESRIEYDKKKQDAFVIDFPYTQEVVETAFVQFMEKLGYKAKEEKGLFNKDKGFIVFKNAFIPGISTTKSYDYVIKVERKSRKEKDESTLYLIALTDDVNAKSSFDSYDVQRTKTFLGSLRPNMEAADLEAQIKVQEDAVAKAEKKLEDLKKDQSDLEKKLDDNRKDQENTQQDIETKKKELGILIGRRGN
jgi:hypothetical protein